MKVTLDELNLAYAKVNEYKLDGYPIRRFVTVDIDRNPLTDSEYFDNDSDFVTVVKLKFEHKPDLGIKGSYVLVSDIDIIDKDDVDEEYD